MGHPEGADNTSISQNAIPWRQLTVKRGWEVG